jgi:hypothetical protein
MQEETHENVGNRRNGAESFRTVPNGVEGFGNLPSDAETFRNLPHDSEAFGNVRKVKERTENHTLTVREVARHFEDAGVPRTERSIINWCRPNRQGVPRLDAFFDENERRYYITPQSVTRAIEEERAKQFASPPTGGSESIPKAPESDQQGEGENDARVKELELKNRDLEIATRGKDFYIKRLEQERTQHVDQLVGMSRYVGELETQVLQLGGTPRGDRTLPNASENASAPSALRRHEFSPPA